MTKLVVENGHYKDTCYNKIGVSAQNVLTILGPTLTRLAFACPF